MSKLRLICLVAAFALASCGQDRIELVFDIPEGFNGWVLVEFEVPSCEALSDGHGRHLLVIGADGRSCTSRKLEFGWAHDKFYFVGKSRSKIPVTGWGGGGLIWARANGTTEQMGGPKRVFEHFYVGTEEQFRSAGPPPRL